MIDADKQEPNIGPNRTNAEYEIAAPDLPEKQRTKNDRNYNDHQGEKYGKGVQTIDYPDRYQQEFHPTNKALNHRKFALYGR